MKIEFEIVKMTEREFNNLVFTQNREQCKAFKDKDDNINKSEH